MLILWMHWCFAGLLTNHNGDCMTQPIYINNIMSIYQLTTEGICAVLYSTLTLTLCCAILCNNSDNKGDCNQNHSSSLFLLSFYVETFKAKIFAWIKYTFNVSALCFLYWGCPISHQSRAIPGQTRPPVTQRRRELSQCFLSDCRALRFQLCSKLCASVPDCHTNSPFHSPLSSPCPPPFQPVTTPSAHKQKEYQTHSS